MWPQVRFNVIGDAWRLYQRHWGVWSLAVLIVLIANSAVFALLDVRWPGGRGGFRLPMPPGAFATQYLASTVISGFFLGGLIRMAANQVRGRVPRVEHLFAVTDVWLDLLLAALFYGAATFLASLLCVIPGVIVAGLFRRPNVDELVYTLCAIPGVIVAGLLMFAIPLVVEARLPATGAILQSWNALKSQWLTATVFHFVLFVLSGSGFLLCCIGILVTGPLYCLSIAILYHEFFPASSATTWKKPVDPFPEV